MTSLNEEFYNCTSVGECLSLRDRLMDQGEIGEIKAKIASAPKEQKKELGARLNQIRKGIQSSCDNRILEIQAENEKDDFVSFDATFYSDKYFDRDRGSAHPLTETISDIVKIFTKMGFDVHDGNLLLSQWNNFSSLNIPGYHPARDMQDTFFLDIDDEKGEKHVMRTQTTSNYVEYFDKVSKPPFRAVFPGLTFRNETIDATHDINFMQFDVWMVDKHVSVSHLTSLIQQFFAEYFDDPDIDVRLRTSYFPFVNPGFEVDVFCSWIGGGKWLEVGGSGLTHPNVFSNLGVDSDEWQGLAWGFGIERLAMIKHQLNNIGQFYSGNLDFLKGE